MCVSFVMSRVMFDEQVKWSSSTCSVSYIKNTFCLLNLQRWSFTFGSFCFNQRSEICLTKVVAALFFLLVLSHLKSPTQTCFFFFTPADFFGVKTSVKSKKVCSSRRIESFRSENLIIRLLQSLDEKVQRFSRWRSKELNDRLKSDQTHEVETDLNADFLWDGERRFADSELTLRLYWVMS